MLVPVQGPRTPECPAVTGTWKHLNSLVPADVDKKAELESTCVALLTSFEISRGARTCSRKSSFCTWRIQWRWSGTSSGMIQGTGQRSHSTWCDVLNRCSVDQRSDPSVDGHRTSGSVLWCLAANDLNINLSHCPWTLYRIGIWGTSGQVQVKSLSCFESHHWADWTHGPAGGSLPSWSVVTMRGRTGWVICVNWTQRFLTAHWTVTQWSVLFTSPVL